MDYILHFVKEKQKELSPTKQIVISIGLFLEHEKILNCNLEETSIKNLLKQLQKKRYKYKVENSRIYREANMEYSIKENGEFNITNRCLTVKNINVGKLGFRLKLIEFLSEPIEHFPSRLNYCDEFNRSTIIVNYNNLLELHIITDERSEIKHLKIEIRIVRQNIYEDKLLTNLTELIQIIQSHIKVN